MSHRGIKPATAIVDRRAGDRAVTIFRMCNHEILLAVRRHDTANSAVMSCLGLDEPERDLVLRLSPKTGVDCLLRTLDGKIEPCKPRHDIAFTLSLTGISLAVTDILGRHEDQTRPSSHPAEHKEDIPVTSSHSYELIASIIRTDLSTSVAETIKRTGCQGDTPIRARKIGSDVGKRLFDMALPREKAILLILAPTSLGAPIPEPICETIMEGIGEHTAAISLPVDIVGGLTG